MHYEVNWQIDEIEDGRKIQQATVPLQPGHWRDPRDAQQEDSADYRYFPDSDLPPLVIEPAWVEEARALRRNCPEMSHVVSWSRDDYGKRQLLA